MLTSIFIFLFSDWKGALLIQVCWQFWSQMGTEFCQIFWNDHIILPIYFVNMVSYIGWFLNVISSLRSLGKLYLIMMYYHFIYHWISFVSIIVGIFASISWVILVCTFFLQCFCQILVSGLCWLPKMIWEIFSSQFLERVCVRVVLFLLRVFNNTSPLQKSTLGLEILFMETITNSVVLIDIGPFRASISSCISFDKFLFQGICSPHVCSWVYWHRVS